MNLIEKKIISFFLGLLLLTNSNLAQSLRKPNSTEGKIFDKAIPIITSLLDRFGNNDWSLKQNWYNGEPLVPVDYDDKGPIAVADNFERVYEVIENSERFNKIIKPLYDKVKILSDRLVAEIKEYEKNPPKDNKMEKDPVSDSLDVLDKKLKELTELDVYVYINRGNISGSPATDVKVNGSAIVTKINIGYMQNDYFKSYFIAFGNWRSAKWNAEDNLYEYIFKKTKAPSIQNIVVVMTGAPDRMKELMQKIDWSVLNNALTD